MNIIIDINVIAVVTRVHDKELHFTVWIVTLCRYCYSADIYRTKQACNTAEIHQINQISHLQKMHYREFKLSQQTSSQTVVISVTTEPSGLFLLVCYCLSASQL